MADGGRRSAPSREGHKPQKCAPIGIHDRVQRVEIGISRSICWSGGSGRVRPVQKGIRSRNTR